MSLEYKNWKSHLTDDTWRLQGRKEGEVRRRERREEGIREGKRK